MEETLGKRRGCAIASIYPSLWAESITYIRTTHLISKFQITKTTRLESRSCSARGQRGGGGTHLWLLLLLRKGENIGSCELRLSSLRFPQTSTLPRASSADDSAF